MPCSVSSSSAGGDVESFTVAYVPGVTLNKWARIWAERGPAVPLQLLSTTESEQTAVLHEGRAQTCFVRLPVDRDGLNVIPLYTEVAVVVAPKEHPVALFDEVTLDDLAAEPRIPEVAGQTVADALALVAAGLGIVIVPQSIARLHNRRDLVYRPITDEPPTQVGLAWLAEHTSEHIEEFIGIVRGRTVNSSRANRPAETSPPAPRAAKGRRRTSSSRPRPRS